MNRALPLLPLGLILAGLLVALPSSGRAEDKETDAKDPPVKVTEDALRLHREAILVDGHNDLPWQFRKKEDLSFQKIDIARPQPKLHTDIPRLRKGGVGAQFWSAFVPAETRKKGT